MYRFPAISHHSRKSTFRSITSRGSSFGAAQMLSLAPAAWFRWNVGITVATGVSSWADQSGNTRDLLQGTGASQPTKQADGSIVFNGTSHTLKCTGFTLVQPETIYLLFKQVTWTASARLWDGNLANTGAALQLTATPQIFYNAGSSIGPVSPALGAVTSLCVVANGASSSIQINSDAPVTGNAGAANMGGFTLGAAGGATNFSNIQVYEAIIFPTAHSATTRTRVLRYLSRLGAV